VRHSKIFHLWEIGLRTEDDAEGSREARAIECGSKVDSRGHVRRDGTTLNWSTPSVSDGSTPEPAVTRVPRRRSLCSVCARLRIARWGSDSELKTSRNCGCRPTIVCFSLFGYRHGRRTAAHATMWEYCPVLAAVVVIWLRRTVGRRAAATNQTP
jgi:hypothetical protein